MSRWNLSWLVGIPLVILLGLTLTYSAPVQRGQTQDYELFQLLAGVLAEVDQNYVRELDPAAKRRLVEDMINGGLERLDPHSTFLGAVEYKQFDGKSKGKFGGVGIQVNLDRNTGLLQVISPMVGTPAYEAGVMAGDLILKVDGKALENLRYNEIIGMIQGEPGTPVTLTVLHESEKKAVDIPITRAIVEVETVLGDRRKADNPKEWDFILDKDPRIAYVRLSEFGEPTSEMLGKLLKQLAADGVRGLILDLRGNPGGLLTSAVEVSDLFLNDGRIVSTQGRKTTERVYDAKSQGVPFEQAAKFPVAVLIDRYSASASEIVSAALQDHSRAVIVGERSYGKGSVQNVFPMEDSEGHKMALKLTTQSYRRPSGHNIHRWPDSKDTDEWGVKPTPGFEVKLTDEERLQYLLGRRKRDIVQGKGNTPPADKKDVPLVDKVLDRALEHLRAEVAKTG
jgi:carboxyl-terminal processing protease